MPNSPEHIAKLKTIACYYFLALAVLNIVATAIYKTPGIADIVILILALLPLLIRNSKFHLFFGAFALTLWTYLFLAVSADYMDYAAGKKFTHPLRYFGIGYALTMISAGVSLMMIYTAEIPLSHSVKK